MLHSASIRGIRSTFSNVKLILIDCSPENMINTRYFTQEPIDINCAFSILVNQ